jgi:phenylacetate-CoA ligase
MQRLYHKAIGYIPYERRLSAIFSDTYCFLQESQWWSEEKLLDYQFSELKKLIHYSYENVSYYRNLFYRIGVHPDDITRFEDVKKIPLLTKDAIRENTDKLISKLYHKKDLIAEATAGTTSLPLRFYSERYDIHEKEWAFIATLWARVGYNINKRNRYVTLRGTLPHNGYYEYRGLELVLSSFSIIEEKMDEYLDRIIRFKPDYIRAYPSSISLLADHVRRKQGSLHIPSLKAVLCASENLSSFQQDAIEKAFGVRVFSHYGQSEKCCLAGYCEESSNYHIFKEYGYTEILDADNREVTEENGVGEIVATGFLNYAMPFIRYRTGDMAVVSSAKCTCGRNYRLIKRIDGRIGDYFVDKSGSLVPSTCADEGLRLIIEKVANFQFLQNEPGQIELNVVFREEPAEHDIQKVETRFKDKFPRFSLVLNRVDKIDRTASGKQRFFVQHLPVAEQGKV